MQENACESVHLNAVVYEKSKIKNKSSRTLTILSDFPSGRLEDSEREGRCDNIKGEVGFL